MSQSQHPKIVTRAHAVTSERPSIFTSLWPLLIGLVTVAALFAWEGHKGLNLGDEGYLWYGVQRVMAGEIPIRDFQAYDPGRYFWSGWLMRLTGREGIIALRYTVIIWQAAALAAALGWLAVVNRRSNFAFVLICALTLVAWMVPRHKLFDIAISIALVCAFTSWLKKPSLGNHLLAGAFVGLAAYFGRNHGIYGVMAAAGIFAYLALRCEDWSLWRRGLAMFIVGGFLGYTPMFVTLALAPGFTPAFIDSIRFLFEVKATNLPLPVPWPWLTHVSGAPLADALRGITIGLFFVGITVFAFLSVIYVLACRWRKRPISPLVVACAFCSVPYAHYAFSRADSWHLAQGIFPALIGLLAVAASMKTSSRLAICAPLCALSLFATMPMHPGWQCLEQERCAKLTSGPDTLWVDKQAANDVNLLHRLRDDFAPNGQSFFVTPFQPGAYAVLGAKAPTWEIYTAWPRDERFQNEEIARLYAAKPGFLLISDAALDGREELRFRNTHPLIDRYVHDNYLPVNGYAQDPAYRIYKAKDTMRSSH